MITTTSTIKVTSISIDSGDYDKATHTTQYNITVLPANATNKTVVWSSSNPEVIKIDANTGKATLIGKGDTTITCKATDGSGVYKSISSRNDYVAPTQPITPPTQPITPPTPTVQVPSIRISSENWDETTATLQYTTTITFAATGGSEASKSIPVINNYIPPVK